MSISSTGSTTASTYTTAATASPDQINNPNAALGKNDFLTMLMTQLENQDPLSATDDSAMVADMAQFSSLEQMSDMNTNIVGLMAMQNTSQAAALIGKTVTVTNPTTGLTDTGAISVVNFVSGTPMITVNNQQYGLSAITQIQA